MMAGVPDERTGYRSPVYAQSLSEFGRPRPLPRSGGWVLERGIGAGPHSDAMGCYPLFSCMDWSLLNADLDELAGDLICISLVTDPFGQFDARELAQNFKHKCFPFKLHFVADLGRRPGEFVSKHHRYYARRALGQVEVARCDEPRRFLDEWIALYDNLIARHHLSGIKAFSRQAFDMQLSVPGAVMLRATCGGETVGAHIWYLQGDVVHSHLFAASRRGYELSVSFALYWFALQTFAGEANWINFGAAAGLDGDGRDGLAQFKRGWATDTRPTYFCGRIFDGQAYARELAARGLDDGNYFPAYRSGEFS